MQQVRIDFDNPGLPQSLGVVEGESQSRIFQAALYKSGAAYTAPAGAVYSIMYRGFGPQNQGWYDTIEDGAGKRAACTVSGNVVTCELARQALRVPGHLTVVLCVSDAKGYMLKSWPIMADVRNDGYEDTGEIEMYFNLSGLAGNYLTQLEKAMADAETTKNTLTSTSAQVQKDIDAKAAAALKSIPESYTELDGSVKQLKEDLVDCIGENSEIRIEWIPDKYIDAETGDVIDYKNWLCSEFLEIGNAKQLQFATDMGGTLGYNCWYNARKVKISSFNIGENNGVETPPDNAKYFRVSKGANKYVLVKRKFDPLVNKCNPDDVKKIINGQSFDKRTIVALNADIKPFIIQAHAARNSHFNDSASVLSFIHLSDVHKNQNAWNRMIEFANSIADYSDFIIHSGDYCGSSQPDYIDLIGEGIKTTLPIYQAVGNHDTFSDSSGTRGTKQVAYNKLFNHTNNWKATFMNGDYSMTYYVDFSNAKIRMIVLDNYYDQEAQCTWLQSRLDEAKTLGYHVITCTHEMTNPIIDKLDTHFQNIENFEQFGSNTYSTSPFDKIISDWKKNGGIHVINLAGHEHADFIGYTTNGILNLCIECATDSNNWTDADRVENTRTYDCFNYVSVNQNSGHLKIVRIGNNSDYNLREKKTLCYDYINKQIIK